MKICLRQWMISVDWQRQQVQMDSKETFVSVSKKLFKHVILISFQRLIGHFTAMAVDRSTRIGCGLSTFKTTQNSVLYNNYLLACNYASTNILSMLECSQILSVKSFKKLSFHYHFRLPSLSRWCCSFIMFSRSWFNLSRIVQNEWTNWSKLFVIIVLSTYNCHKIN